MVYLIDNLTSINPLEKGCKLTITEITEDEATTVMGNPEPKLPPEGEDWRKFKPNWQFKSLIQNDFIAENLSWEELGADCTRTQDDVTLTKGDLVVLVNLDSKMNYRWYLAELVEA